MDFLRRLFGRAPKGYKTQKNNNGKKPAAKPKSPEKTRKAATSKQRPIQSFRSNGYNETLLLNADPYQPKYNELFAQPGARSTNKNRLVKTNKGTKKAQKQLEKEVKNRIEQEKRLAKSGFTSYSNFNVPTQKPTSVKPGRRRASELFGSSPEPNLNAIFGLGKKENLRNFRFNESPRSGTRKPASPTKAKAVFKAARPSPAASNNFNLLNLAGTAPPPAAKGKRINLAALYGQDPFADTGLPPGAGAAPPMSPKAAEPSALNRQIREQQEILAKLARKVNFNSESFSDEEGQQYVDAVNALKPLLARRNRSNPPTGKMIQTRAKVNAVVNKIRRTLKNRAEAAKAGDDTFANLFRASAAPPSPRAASPPKRGGKNEDESPINPFGSSS
jgi:hypothetical protein